MNCQQYQNDANRQFGQTMPMNSFGTRLQAARVAKGLTQESLAFDVGVTKSAVSSWESDRTEPELAAMVKLRRLLNVSLDSLICGDALLDADYPFRGVRDEMAVTPLRKSARDGLEDSLLERFRAASQGKRVAILELLKPGK